MTDFKYATGTKVIYDGKVAEVMGHELIGEMRIYKLQVEKGDFFWNVMVSEDNLSTALPGRFFKCECGADAIFGTYNTMHADYCQKYVPHESFRKTN